MNNPGLVGGMIALPIGFGYTVASIDITRYGLRNMRRDGIGRVAIGGIQTLIGMGGTLTGIGVIGTSLFSIANRALGASRSYVESRPRM